MLSEGRSTRTISKRIALDELHEYISTPAQVAEDVVIPSGATLITRGTKLASLGSSVEELKKSLGRWDILSIPVTIQNDLDMIGLEDMLRAAREKIPSIDPLLASETVAQVENVYGRISEGICEPADVSSLAAQGRIIAQEIAQAPQLMLCLGKVRNWDEYTYVHSLNVALLSGFLANRLFPDNPELAENVTVGGILHDLGKALVPKNVLNKPGRLTDAEYTLMKKHTVYGDELAKSNGVNEISTLSVIRGHHEHFGGCGYPDGLKEKDIRIEARIAAVADVFDALTAKRVYKDPMDSRAAVAIMLENMSAHFDPKVVRALLVSVGLFPPGTGVELSDGSIGVVVGANGKDLMRPEVLLQVDSMGRRADGGKVVDLSKSEDLYVRRPMQDVGKVAFWGRAG
ncbi:MAG: HD-GYP domain-containing protein [Synergistaceae bacterium]|nr:HD-GYP domain-containing protein [Synergistaceae bacterium]